MSHPQTADDVKLIASLFSPDADMVDQGIRSLEDDFGPTDWVSPSLFFDRTRYYEREMGWPLYRKFVSFKHLIRPDDIAEIKLETNAIERLNVENGKRRLNIDPGYVSLERLLLATGKNYTHRVYLSHGIYADLTLIFQKGGFRPLEWTYRDYSDPEVIDYFNQVRERYKTQLRGISAEKKPQ